MIQVLLEPLNICIHRDLVIMRNMLNRDFLNNMHSLTNCVLWAIN